MLTPDKNLNQPATKGDIQAIKGDIQAIKGDIQAIKGDIQTLRDVDIKQVREDLGKNIKQVRDNLSLQIVRSDAKTETLIKGLEDKLEKWKNEIVTSNDKVAKDYQTFETENAAINANYDTVSKRVHKLETFAAIAAPKFGVAFERP